MFIGVEGGAQGDLCNYNYVYTIYNYGLNYFPTPVTMQPYIHTYIPLLVLAKSHITFVCCRCIKLQCSTCTCVADIDLCASDLHFCGKHSGCVYTGECGCSYWGCTR